MRLCLRRAGSIILASISVLGTACTTRLPAPPVEDPATLRAVLPSPAPNPTPTFTPFQPEHPPVGARQEKASPTVKPPLDSPRQPTLGGAVTPPTARPSQPLALLSTPGTPGPPSPAAGGITLWVDPLLPGGLQDALQLPEGFEWVGDAGGAALRLEVGETRPVSRWIYALVTPFPSLEQGTSSEALLRRWREGGGPLWVDESTLHVLAARWGDPGPGAVNIASAEELLERAWESRPAWAIVPFEALEPRWKVLEVDGFAPIRKGFDPGSYPLAVPVSLDGDLSVAEAVQALHGPGTAAPLAIATNRDPGWLTTVVMTGVTALVRATAFAMEQKGIQYPGRDIGDWLREADLTHISNEVPFARDCPYPNPVQEGMRFCSDPRYLALLENVGTDIVELTGDHFQDWGTAAMQFTLDLYHERGWLTYGGGATLDEGRRAAIVEHNGNRLAFIGCNGKGGSYAQAGARQPGAVACGEGDWMAAEIARLRGEGYLVIATFQHFEYYTYAAQPNQKRDFRRMAHAGAAIVSGSQAHQPQALEFSGDAFIHYGLGNLFFDQYDVSLATRQGFIDRHVFYGGRYISTELLPILFVDYARPRPMDSGEREDLLRAVFRASGW